MGLEAGVGELLAFPEAWIVKSLRRDFRYLSKALALAGHPGFEEPERLPRKAVYSSSIGPYSTLHRLRRVAAHLWKTGRLPRPRAGPATQDPVLRAAYRHLGRKGGGTGFDHLLFHSDCDGYYAPIDFPRVIVSQPPSPLEGSLIGSSQQLLRECRVLAERLQLPLDLDPGSDEVQAAVAKRGRATKRWQRFAVESCTCLALHRLAELSVRYRSAIRFS